MAVTGKRVWYIAAVILGREFTYRRLEWDDALISQMTAAEQYFWKNHVEKGIMPDPDGSKACDEVLRQYFHTARKSVEIELVGFDEKLDRRAALLEQIAPLQQELNQIEQEVKLYMKDNETASSSRFKVMWSSVEKTSLDTKRIKLEKPEIYQEYAKVSVSRRFQIKSA